MILTTKRLILRPWTEADAPELYKYAGDPRVGDAAGWQAHKSVEESREIIRTIFSGSEVYAVCRKEDGRPIGCVGLRLGQDSNFKLPEHQAELGYWLGVPFWGQGLMTEAARAVVHRAFAQLQTEALWAGYFDGNERSRRVMEKCGFVPHHTNERCFWEPLGIECCEKVECLTKARWEQFSVCGADCANCPMKGQCNGCARSGACPFGTDCLAARLHDAGGYDAFCKELLEAVNALGIADMEKAVSLNPLCGAFVNLPLALPNGERVKFLEDSAIYLGTQLHKQGTDRCYGICADETYLMVCEYGWGGEDPILTALHRWR